ncbi:hypothetical protein IFM89_019388 [Coptis chinensis]|uniref:Trichome birefringence-like C-terminal domain-containing protein n=1 Tax=Coptis chinensis TaxID=261450 RepID=A0A835IS65_9MAGN|nr:hypothetical protein IFM89_019388 [Coptis chinensis]
MFVGDSLTLNQWQSLTCMLHMAVPNANYTLNRSGGISTFAFPGYGVKFVLFRTGFLVDIVTEKIGRVLKLDSIGYGKVWLRLNKNVDIHVFYRWDYIQEGKKVYKDMDRLVAYEKALKTWANWVDTKVDPTKTRVLFQGISPDHNSSAEWKNPKAQNCFAQQEPLKGSKYQAGPHPAETVAKKVLSTMKKRVYLLDITTLSQLRIDGHPSGYSNRGHRGMDCSHWCLAGVPDTWNQILYAVLKRT